MDALQSIHSSHQLELSIYNIHNFTLISSRHHLLRNKNNINILVNSYQSDTFATVNIVIYQW